MTRTKVLIATTKTKVSLSRIRERNLRKPIETQASIINVLKRENSVDGGLKVRKKAAKALATPEASGQMCGTSR
jgi:hypothetical protein